jgi:hypothetical protein
MPEADVERLREENERLHEKLGSLNREIGALKGALTSKEEVLIDLWGHKAYLVARQRLTRFVTVMVAVVGLLGAGFFFDVYMKVNKYVETELKLSP